MLEMVLQFITRSKIDKYVYGETLWLMKWILYIPIDIDTENDIKIAEIFQRNLRQK